MSNKKKHSLDRVVDIAASSFSRSQVADVSIRAIAAQAKCSLATIYDVFESKEGLYRAAVERHLKQSQFAYTPASARNGETAIDVLLTFLEQRICFLMDPERAVSHRLVSAYVKMSGDVLREVIDQERVRISSYISEAAKECIEAGFFRKISVDAITYVLMACTAYDSFSEGLFQGRGEGVDTGRILSRALAPFVTAKGQRSLEAYVAKRSLSPARYYRYRSVKVN